MRRLLLPALVLAALALAVPAFADLRPVDRRLGEIELPRVRPGTVQVPSGHAEGRITVVVRLAGTPLAQWHRSLHGTAVRRKLNASSSGAKAHLARLAAAQRRAEATLRRAIPAAEVQRRYRIVLNGLAVELPARDLPELVRLGVADRVYPSYRYRLATNLSPELIAAEALGGGDAGTGGAGTKIGVVDDGVDAANPFFDPSGYEYPAGFPKGGTRWTTPKVIVARSFPGPGSGRPGRLAVDPRASFHGTHVAGIAAGNAGTDAPAGEDHPAVAGLAGVAPRAWIGNYRVFTVPTPIGHVANTPEIVAAFEAAVRDGMDVINFSGGGPQTEPATDALVEAVANVAAAGVVPVVSAGNDRDEFGLGTAGSPGTAPEAISVAALSNSQVFAGTLAAAELGPVPFRAAPGAQIPAAWATLDQTLVDAGALADPYLCGTGGDPNEGPSPLAPGSLEGAIALVLRGRCTFVSKAERARAAGAAGIVLVDNRPGEANGIPTQLPLPGGMIADLDGARIRTALARTGGRGPVRIDPAPARIVTGRSGIVTSFSSAGPTAFGHDLKPDVGAPGGQILSATLPVAGGPFAVFDGTSMAAPHVAGAAALLLERHPGWTPRTLKAALVGTAGPAWANTARTEEAPVTLGGGGLVRLDAANAPLVVAQPSSLSFPDLDVNAGARREALLTRIADANGGGGTWEVSVRPQAATAGVDVEVPGVLSIAPHGGADLVVAVRAAADAAAGQNYGFVVLRRGAVERRIPYFALVTRPAFTPDMAAPLQRFQVGDTRGEGSRTDRYWFPSAPFGPSPSYTGPPMDQDGKEALYVLHLERPVANFGVAVEAADAGSAPDPWVLGSPDQNDVQGYAGTPVNVNPLTFGYRLDIGAAGASLPKPGRYFVSVDSGRDVFTGRRLAGRYVLRAWVDDVLPPLVVPVTARVSAGRPTLVMRILDDVLAPGAGVDPTSLAIGYRGVLVGAAAYDPVTGYAVFPLPRQAPALRAGRTSATVVASDYQEAKNVNTSGEDVMPNTAFRGVRLQVVARPTVHWLLPEDGACLERRQRLTVVAASTAALREVRFFAGSRRIATVRRGQAGLYTTVWSTAGAKKGAHRLRAVVVDAAGERAAATVAVRVCR